MKPITAEWVSKAEGDYVTAQRESQAPITPNYDAAVFHAQQCAEKYLKARLIEAGIAFPKTHDLEAILRLILPLEPSWQSLLTALQALTSIGIEVRYPGTSADTQDAERAIQTAGDVRSLSRATLGLPL
jgi:HEPN domain-containing protein